MEQERINILINRYFEGATTLVEERQIADYLRIHDNLTDEQKALKAIMRTTVELRELTSPVEPIKHAKSRSTAHVRLWLGGVGGAVAAAVVVGIVIFGKRSDTDIVPQTRDEGIICYKDGVRVNDNLVARAEVDEILGGVAGDLQFAMECINNVTTLPSAIK